jgi:N-acetylated-alpha-linked acidic dipeptidase
MLEEARALGELLKQGWRPKRTIIYCAWDGEEPMLLGSTEWAETHEKDLKEHAVAYINSDGNGRGYLDMEGSHTLEHFMNSVAADIEDPETKLPVSQRIRLRGIAGSRNADDRQELRQRADLRLEALGSGSDYTAFIDHLGIASLNVGFGGEDNAGIYHSIYDDFYWYTHFSDTEFVYGRALSQTIGTAVMRLADADLLPFEFGGLTDAVRLYVKQLKKAADDSREELLERNKEIEEGVFNATRDPKHPRIAPPKEIVPPHLNFAPLENALDGLAVSAQRYQSALARRQNDELAPAMLQNLNRTLMEAEQRLTNSDGLPGRSWYRHMLYAPGVYSGYGVKTIPGVREAIEQKHWDLANTEIGRAAAVLRSETELIDNVSGQLESAK